MLLGRLFRIDEKAQDREDIAEPSSPERVEKLRQRIAMLRDVGNGRRFMPAAVVIGRAGRFSRHTD